VNFELNDEQRQLQESVDRLLSAKYNFEKRLTIAASNRGSSEAIWHQLAELGVTGLPIPTSYGGFGGGAVDLLPIMQAFGRDMVLEPLLASHILAGNALHLSGDQKTCQRLLPSVAAGEVLLAWAHEESGAHHAECWIETRATRHGDGWILDGVKSSVLHACIAKHIVVTARVSGTPEDTHGRALFLVDAGAIGLLVRPYRLVDDTPAGEITFSSTLAQPLGNPMDSAMAEKAIEGTLGAGTAAVCADMVGSMEAAFKLAMDYLNTRKQFDRLIGENQALRHRAAEMLVSLELCRSMAIGAAIAVDSPGNEDSKTDLLRAKLVIGRHARSLCQQAIQLHGGIGMTEEYAVGHYLRRVHVMDQLFGDSDAQAVRLARKVL